MSVVEQCHVMFFKKMSTVFNEIVTFSLCALYVTSILTDQFEPSPVCPW